MSQMVKAAREALEYAETQAGDSPVSSQKVLIACTRALCSEIADLYTVLDTIKNTIQFASGRPREFASSPKREV